jgi:oligopeptide/dipeptide ABC transporter ATP-binding protein
MGEEVLRVRGLRIRFDTPKGSFVAVDGVDLDLRAGETLGMVGESGCGKSVTALSVMGLLPQPPAHVDAGEVLFEGRNLLRLPPAALREIRGHRVAMIFQEPMTSLNPVFTVGNQIEEVLQVHTDQDGRARRERVLELLELVGIPAPRERLGDYPHQLSGGMRQRVMIAMALACNPAVLIADEPTTALDVTIQAQILELLAQLKRRFRMAVLLITHDLGVIAESAESVAVVYAGRVVETAPAEALFRAPRHPYTQGLLLSVPGPQQERRTPLRTIPGVVPDLRVRPVGCSFRERCPRAQAICAEADPKLEPMGRAQVACHNPVPEPA